MRFIIFFLLCFTIVSCKQENSKDVPNIDIEEPIKIEDADSSSVVTKDFREFKVLDSKYLSNSEIWKEIEDDLSTFSEEDYLNFYPLIFEQDIPTIQGHIKQGNLTYENLTKFYLYRINKFDRENPLSLNSVISINSKAIESAREKDKQNNVSIKPFSVFGMPILLKDNINAKGMPTTAGAVALQENYTNDAHIVRQLKKNGAIILGKTNLSEWAYFFCGDCPSGYSAIGGQTLNPYGRRLFSTGGSSSGSGVAVASNFCVAAVGSETSGSILSPSSQNSVVGLKPTIGLVGRSGIVPISSTLDTAGPMTKNVVDNAILLGALFGEDKEDDKSIWSLWKANIYYEDLAEDALIGKRFGAIKSLMEDTLYVKSLEVLKAKGARIIEIEPEKKERSGFISLLNLDMRNDLPSYLKNYASKTVKVKSIADVIEFNNRDSINSAPYGQRLFKAIVADSGTAETLDSIKRNLKTIGKQYFDVPRKQNKLDAILSINNYHANYAAVAEYPAITVPMGYSNDGKPKGLTFIAERLREKQLLELAYAFEQASKSRKPPKNYN